MTDQSKDKIRVRLTTLRNDISALDDSVQADKADITLDQSKVGRLSRMDAIQAQQMEKATHRRRVAELQAIDAALNRLASGEYGYCQQCGEEISHARLDHNPAVSTCIACAR